MMIALMLKIQLFICSLHHSSENGHIPSHSSQLSLKPSEDPKVSEEYGRGEMGGDPTRTSSWWKHL